MPIQLVAVSSNRHDTVTVLVLGVSITRGQYCWILGGLLGIVLTQVVVYMAVSNSQVIGCKDRLQNDLYCVGWGVKLYSIQSCVHGRFGAKWPRPQLQLLTKPVLGRHRQAAEDPNVITDVADSVTAQR